MEPWLDRLRREIEQTTEALTEQDWNRAPQGRWSIAQILDHLGKTYAGTAKMVEEALRQNQGPEPRLRPATLKERIFQFLVVTLGSFPNGRKAPDFIAPQPNCNADALPRTLSQLQRMREALVSAEQCWGSNPVAIHFVLGPLSAPQWRKLHYVHGHHHVKQIRQRLARR
jgi:uncharacterized protein DUF1569